jgi:hypothetical protein
MPVALVSSLVTFKSNSKPVARDCDSFLPVYVSGQVCKVYVEDDFPWWCLKLGRVDEDGAWFVIGCEGKTSHAKTTPVDRWIEEQRGVRSKRYYALVEMISHKTWRFFFNGAVVAFEEIMRKISGVLPEISNVTHDRVVYSAEYESANPKSLALGISAELPDWIAVDESKTVLSRSPGIFLKYRRGGEAFSAEIQKSDPSRIVVRDVDGMDENAVERVVLEIREMSRRYEPLLPGSRPKKSLPKGSTRFASINNVILPEVIFAEEIPEVEASGRYALEHEGTYYTCPLGYYPCVTENRKMKNNDEIKFIVKCSSRGKPNVQRSTSESNYVFVNQSRVLREGDRGKCSRTLLTLLSANVDAHREGVEQDEHAFLRAVASSLKIDLDPVKFRAEHVFDPWIAKQENPFRSPDEILNEFRDPSAPLSGLRYYRVLEEAFDCNVVLISVTKTKTSFWIPKSDDLYVWKPKETERTSLIVANTSAEEGAFKRTYYEYVPYRKALSSVLENKTEYVNSQRCTWDGSRVTRVIPAGSGWTGQQLNEDGKCVALERDGRWYTCVDAPRDLPVKQIKEESLPTITDLGERVASVDVLRGKVIGAWLEREPIYCPLKPSAPGDRPYPRGPRCAHVRRPLFGEEANRSRPKQVTLYGGRSLSEWASTARRYGSRLC